MERIVVDRWWAPLKIRILTVAKFQQISRLEFGRKGRENGVVQLSFVCKFACTFSTGELEFRFNNVYIKVIGELCSGEREYPTIDGERRIFGEWTDPKGRALELKGEARNES